MQAITGDEGELELARASDLRSRAILESITDGFFTLDRGWRFDYLNPEAERILGREPGALLGKVLWDEYPGTIGTAFEQTYRRVAAGGPAESFLAWYADHGSWYDVRAFPSSAGLTIYFRDVTEARQAEAALRASEAQRRLALDAAELGAWNIDPLRTLLISDERFRTIFTGSTAPLSYMEAVAAVHEDDRERVRAAVIAAVRPHDPLPYAIEYRIVRRDGEVHWVFAKGRATFEGEGSERRLLSFDGTLADITDRKAADELLRRTESRFRTLFESIDEGFCVIEMIFDATGRAVDYRFIEANPAFERQTGIEGAVGKTMLDVAPDMDAFWFETYGQVATTGLPVRFVNEATALQRWFDVYAFRTGGAEERRVAVLFNDISARKRAEEKLAEADRRKDEFLATLAHELRNPLAPIRSSLEIIRRAGPNAATVERARQIMERQVGQMVRLVDDLLDVSRISGGKLELRRERTTLAAVIDSAVETSRPLLEASGVQWAVRLPEESIEIDADLTRLAQVFMNLLNNAAKFTDRGGQVSLVASSGAGEVVVTVSDSGIGIAPENLKNVFDMFAQVTSSLERSQGGLGIGLSLVRRLVELHGGRVEARSAGSGLGSQFAVTLPTLVPLAGGLPPAEAAATAAARQLEVLVVDDNVDVAESAAELLELMGHATYMVHDGLAAVEAAASRQPDVVLLDIGMPGLNGYEAASRIRQLPGGPAMVLIALTGWGQHADRLKAVEAGFDHHLVKPVDPDKLETLLASLVPRPR